MPRGADSGEFGRRHARRPAPRDHLRAIYARTVAGGRNRRNHSPDAAVSTSGGLRMRNLRLMDFSYLRDAARLSTLTDDAIRLAGSAATPHSDLALLDLTGTRVDGATLAALRNLSQHSGPFIRLMAFAGLGAIPGRAPVDAARHGARQPRGGQREARSLEWLTSQQAPS